MAETTEVVIEESAEESIGPSIAEALSFLSEEAPEAPEVSDEPVDPIETAGEPEAPAAAPEAPAPAYEATRLMEKQIEQERQLSLRRREMDQARAELEAREAKIREYQEFADKLEKGDVLAALESRGYNFDQLADAAAKGTGLNPNKEVEAQIHQLKAEQEAMRREHANLQRQRLEMEAAAEIQQQIAQRAETAPHSAAVPEIASDMFRQVAIAHKNEGRAFNYDAIASEVESGLSNFIQRLLSVDAVKRRYLPDQVEASQAPEVKSKTLSASQAATVATRIDQDTLDELSAEDAARAIFSNPDNFNS